jgi:N-acetylneuraminic acid mutarotase
MVLAATSPAQAATAGRGSTAGVSSGAAAAAKAKPAGGNPAKAKPAWAPSAPVTPTTADTRAACVKVKAGYSTCMSIRRTNVPHYKGLLPAATASRVGYGPAQLQSAYNLPSATLGSGETVAVVDAYDNPHAEADLQLYRAQYGLPVCNTANGCFAKVNQDGLASPLPPAAGTAGTQSYGWDLEVALDIDMVSAICPNCRILLVVANSNSNNDLYTAEDTAVAMGAKFVSNSWSGLEYPGETADNAHFNHPGVVIAAAAGDSGYGTLYPAASRYVTAVGGTDLMPDSSGWQEYAWHGTGSGCSFYEPKPAWQTDTGCQNRTESDVSAVADPSHGVAVYDSYSQTGWTELGGTSVATPVIAATYALAGPPAAGTYPSSYPYAHPSGLKDITQGSNSPVACTPSYLCTAGPGYDGPTGLGTPAGVQAFSSGSPYGTVSGTVSGTSGPLAGATVTVGGGYTTTTGPNGNYTVAVPDGSYTVSAEAPGYRVSSVSNVQVTQNQATTENFTLSAVAHYYTLSGTVSDGSGHHWPLYALIRVSGHPAAVFTNPATGHYSVSVPEQESYTLTVAPLYPGYATATATVSVGTANVTKNIQVSADSTTCSAPGYADQYTGSTQTFTGWSTTPQDGWTVVDNKGDGEVWSFNNPLNYPPPPGGDASFASVESAQWSGDATDVQDTSLVSPAISLSQATSPVITFDTYYSGSGFDPATARVDLSLDGGTTWTTVWEQTTFPVSGLVSIPIPQAAGKSGVQVRFHYTLTGIVLGAYGSDWEIDNVFVGNQTCARFPGGLVTGVVTDHNTGKPLNGASVTSNSHPSQSGTSAATPDDPNMSGGFYWLFASPGATTFTAKDPQNYTPSTQPVNVTADAVTSHNWSLLAGDLAFTPGSLSVTQTSGGGASAHNITFTNTGSAPVHVQLAGVDKGFTAAGSTAGGGASVRASVRGAPLEKIKVGSRPASLMPRSALAASRTARAGTVKGGTPGGIVLHQATPSGTAWTDIANYPTPVAWNAVGYDPGTGDVYSAGGAGALTNAYRYDPLRQQWSQIAPLPTTLLLAASGAFLDGKFYVAGGLTSPGPNVVVDSSSLYAYNPSTGSWARQASMPTGMDSAATAVLNGALYVIGGCTSGGTCFPGERGNTAGVYRYNPSTNHWTTLASYPVPVSLEACAGIDAEIVCAGGVNAATGASLTATYIYNPLTNAWSQGAAMPYDNVSMVYGGSGNMLQIAGGLTGQGHEITNQAAEYNPSSNTWSALPNANETEYGGGGACGLYQVGGNSVDPRTGTIPPTPYADVLPGYDQCGPQTIPWLSVSSSSFTLKPGHSQTVTVTTNSTAASQPGTYRAQLWVETSTPYQFSPIAVAMTVHTPTTWSKVTGTVTDASTGQPLAGATVQVCTKYNTSTGGCGPVQFTLTTDSSGHYQLWLSRDDNPLQIIAAMAGYLPAAKVAQLVQGAPVTVNFALSKSP